MSDSSRLSLADTARRQRAIELYARITCLGYSDSERVALIAELQGNGEESPFPSDLEAVALIDAALRDEGARVSGELEALARWIRTPGNINSDDAIDECARVLENRAATFREDGQNG